MLSERVGSMQAQIHYVDTSAGLAQARPIINSMVSSAILNALGLTLMINVGRAKVALSPGPSQIFSRSCGEKSGEGLGSKLRHGQEMVNSFST